MTTTNFINFNFPPAEKYILITLIGHSFYSSSYTVDNDDVFNILPMERGATSTDNFGVYRAKNKQDLIMSLSKIVKDYPIVSAKALTDYLPENYMKYKVGSHFDFPMDYVTLVDSSYDVYLPVSFVKQEELIYDMEFSVDSKIRGTIPHFLHVSVRTSTIGRDIKKIIIDGV